MTIRTARLGAALLAATALVACAKPADKPVTDTTAAANATPTIVAPIDSATAATAAQPKPDSAKPSSDSAKPAPKK